MSKLKKFRDRHDRPPKRNPPLGTDVIEYIVPGFAAFALTRLLARVAATQIAKRFPKAGRHAGAIAATGSFAAAWWGAHRVKYLENYHHPIVVGSGLAALQSLVQIYLPKLGWILGDPTPAAAPQPIAAQMQSATIPQPQEPPELPAGFRATTPAEWHAYNDAFDAGSYKGKPQAAPPQTAATPDKGEQDISDLLDNSDIFDDSKDSELFS